MVIGLDIVIGAGGGGGGAADLVRIYTGGVAVRDAVYQKGDGTADKADASAVATAEAFLGFVSAIDSPGAGQCEIRFHGDLTGFAGLTPGETYILSTSPGQVVGLGDTINPNYPDATPGSGHVVREVGSAGAANRLFVETGHDFEEN